MKRKNHTAIYLFLGLFLASLICIFTNIGFTRKSEVSIGNESLSEAVDASPIAERKREEDGNHNPWFVFSRNNQTIASELFRSMKDRGYDVFMSSQFGHIFIVVYECPKGLASRREFEELLPIEIREATISRVEFPPIFKHIVAKTND